MYFGTERMNEMCSNEEATKYELIARTLQALQEIHSSLTAESDSGKCIELHEPPNKATSVLELRPDTPIFALFKEYFSQLGHNAESRLEGSTALYLSGRFGILERYCNFGEISALVRSKFAEKVGMPIVVIRGRTLLDLPQTDRLDFVSVQRRFGVDDLPRLREAVYEAMVVLLTKIDPKIILEFFGEKLKDDNVVDFCLDITSLYGYAVGAACKLKGISQSSQNLGVSKCYEEEVGEGGVYAAFDRAIENNIADIKTQNQYSRDESTELEANIKSTYAYALKEIGLGYLLSGVQLLDRYEPERNRITLATALYKAIQTMDIINDAIQRYFIKEWGEHVYVGGIVKTLRQQETD